MNAKTARIMAGIPSLNSALYHRVRFLVGDPTAWLELPGESGPRSVFILRDIEMARAKQHARADEIACPADFTPESGLSGDRETATAQAAAECLCRHGITHVVADRSLPLIFADAIRQQEIEVECDPQWGVIDRRSKDEQEIEWIREAQQMTERAMAMACQTVAKAIADAHGVLRVDGAPLTSERLRAEIDHLLLDAGYSNPTSIVAPGSQGADCHDYGSGPIRTGEPVIIDIFPQNRKTRYNGDCTRTVVHGDIPDRVVKMHAAVKAAKAAAQAATRAGVTGEQVHEATSHTIVEHGFQMGLPADDAPSSYCGMTHGTGHGLGLDVHEPPLLDRKGPELVVGDVLTIEPGLYCKEVGGVRIEDMVVVQQDGCENLNQLPEELDWS